MGYSGKGYVTCELGVVVSELGSRAKGRGFKFHPNKKMVSKPCQVDCYSKSFLKLSHLRAPDAGS